MRGTTDVVFIQFMLTSLLMLLLFGNNVVAVVVVGVA